MLEPQSRNDVVITEAARGEAVVVLDYIKEAERNLNNRENCRKISYNPSTANNKTILKVIWTFQKENLLRKDISEGLKAENPKTPHFYLKSKIYKEGSPGRPVKPSKNC